jgi:hypothetical protein
MNEVLTFGRKSMAALKLLENSHFRADKKTCTLTGTLHATSCLIKKGKEQGGRDENV